MCDDTEYSWRAKGFHNEAVAAGIPAITTAGIYPGVSNGKPKKNEELLPFFFYNFFLFYCLFQIVIVPKQQTTCFLNLNTLRLQLWQLSLFMPQELKMKLNQIG